jgi:uncharacterized protein (TIGR03905 family)
VKRYVFHTSGVCPSEIHLAVRGQTLERVRFVGGGCAGQARLTAKLLAGRPLAEVRRLARGVPCRNGTSCPDQLARALGELAAGRLPLALPVKRLVKPRPCIAVVAHAAGRAGLLARAADKARALGAQEVVLLGDATGPGQPVAANRETLKVIKAHKIIALRGPGDQAVLEAGGLSAPQARTLAAMPVQLVCRVGDTLLTAFHGGHLLDLPGYSVAGPFGLEVMAVAELSLYLEDEDVLPALEALAPDMRARAVVFAHTRRWKRTKLGGVDFINVGPLAARSQAGRPRLELALISAGRRGLRLARRGWAA